MQGQGWGEAGGLKSLGPKVWQGGMGACVTAEVKRQFVTRPDMTLSSVISGSLSSLS